MSEKGKSKKNKTSELKKKGIRRKIQDRKKTTQQMHIVKKPIFKRILAKYMVVGLCMAILIGCVGTITAVSYYRDVAKRDFTIQTNGLADAATESYTQCLEKESTKEDGISAWKTILRWQLNNRRIQGYEARLYDVKTKEVFVDQKCVANIIFREDMNREDRGLRHVLECDWKEMEEAILDYNQWYEEHGMTEEALYMDPSPYLDVKDVYIKAGTFVPGRMQMVINDENAGEEVLKEYDYTPKDTTGYRHFEMEENENYGMLGPIWFFDPDEDVRCELIETYLKADGTYPDMDSLWETSYYSDNCYTFWGMKSVFSEIVTIEDGTEYLLVVGADINLWKSYKGWVISAYIILLILSILITMVIAYRTYMKRLNHYQLDTYRRETTNAMAHDLKTPLMAISGYAENLRNNVHTEKKDYYADLIVDHVAYMNGMVENILELAKVENIGQVTEKENLDLATQTQKILKKYEILTTDKNLWIHVEGACEIEADPIRMEQAIENLIGNAIKYAPTDTEIDIKIDKNFYEIRNRLEGELETPVEELWKPFVKGDNSRNEQRGTGIGLTIVKNIADIHGFELSLQCEEREFVAKIEF